MEFHRSQKLFHVLKRQLVAILFLLAVLCNIKAAQTNSKLAAPARMLGAKRDNSGLYLCSMYMCVVIKRWLTTSTMTTKILVINVYLKYMLSRHFSSNSVEHRCSELVNNFPLTCLVYVVYRLLCVSGVYSS